MRYELSNLPVSERCTILPALACVDCSSIGFCRGGRSNARCAFRSDRYKLFRVDLRLLPVRSRKRYGASQERRGAPGTPLTPSTPGGRNSNQCNGFRGEPGVLFFRPFSHREDRRVFCRTETNAVRRATCDTREVATGKSKDGTFYIPNDLYLGYYGGYEMESRRLSTRLENVCTRPYVRIYPTR